MIDRLLSWLEFRAWMEKITVTIGRWCDCSMLTTVDDDRLTGPILDPTKWPPELDTHR